MPSNLGWALVAAMFGAIVGASEIISRYRDEPLRATVNRYGVAYLAVNGLVAGLSYGLLVRYPTQVLPSVAGDALLGAMAAGFGAMVLLRSKLFIFRTEDGKEYPIGPAIVVETLLRVLDRKIDRMRASARQRRVFEQMKDIRDFDAAAGYLEASLLSFQNLSPEEKREIAAIIQEYRQLATWPASLRTMAVGFAFLTIAGEENFDQVIENLKAYLRAAATPVTAGSISPPAP
ncbi:MAG TPA: hypothetical protein VFV05_09095 [Methylomirabilota bacterium]|nr:hypothetical protein [Methylomirabilota bacterium]